jgi:Zn-dependent protease
MDFKLIDIFFQIIVFLFAISAHESAHAWMANRCGDPTAKMLGRITMNPIKHMDPFGTLLLPAIGLFSGVGMFGWAKPTPVTPENFRNPVLGDILTTLAGPASNFLIVTLSVLALALISVTTPQGHEVVHNLANHIITDTASPLMPIVWLFYTAIYLNVLLGIFNLIPVPPLDGSHVLRHLLPDSVRMLYDRAGLLGLVLLFTVGGSFIRAVMRPALHFVNSLLLNV